jgi:hypothetical protein
MRNSVPFVTGRSRKRKAASLGLSRPSKGKAVVAAAAGFAVFAVLLAFLPAFSALAAVVSVTLWLVGLGAVLWGVQTGRWWLQMAYWEVFLLFFFGMGLRSWSALLDRMGFGILLALALLVHVAAWGFPWLFPRISAALAREQLTPTTRLGRFVQAFSLSLLPGIGGTIFLIQWISEKKGSEDLDTLLIGIIGLTLGIAGPQAISHQFWEKRPWAASPQDAQPRTPG